MVRSEVAGESGTEQGGISMPKNIVVFSDGTGQEGGKRHNTNVYKMFNMIEDRTSKQVAFYGRGLGTGWRKVTGNVAGMGFSRNIQDCYRFIFENYEADDSIYLFGFSRGAATVRSLTSLIHHFGILPKSRPELIRQAYRIYRSSRGDALNERAQEFVRRHHTMWARVKLLGCYDTVAALGLPFKLASAVLDGIPGFRHKFHDFRLSESVENAYQALAIDDERRAFHPVLWDTQIREYQTVRQVWFCGMHTDVGGGYPVSQLSDVALDWMMTSAAQHGLRIYPEHGIAIEGDANGEMHDSRAKGVMRLSRRQVRSWPAGRADKPVLHSSVLQRTNSRDNSPQPAYKPWILDLDYEVDESPGTFSA